MGRLDEEEERTTLVLARSEVIAVGKGGSREERVGGVEDQTYHQEDEEGTRGEFEHPA